MDVVAIILKSTLGHLQATLTIAQVSHAQAHWQKRPVPHNVLTGIVIDQIQRPLDYGRIKTGTGRVDAGPLEFLDDTRPDKSHKSCTIRILPVLTGFQAVLPLREEMVAV